MAAGASLHVFAFHLSDADRDVYETLDLRVARHPSETAEFMLVRMLAWGLEHEEGITFSAGVSDTDLPAVMVRDLTGQMTKWIEVGLPDAARLNRGSKAAGRCAVYCHRDPTVWLGKLADERIHGADAIRIVSFDPDFVTRASAALPRRAALSLSVTGGHLYLDVDGTPFETPVHEHRIG